MFCITIIDILNCSADNIIYSSADVTSQIKTNSKFTVPLKVQCDVPIGTIMFTFEYDKNIEYSKSSIIDNDNGYIVESNKDGIVNITYINTSGIDLSSEKELIEITMKSKDEAESWIEISTSYSTSIDENVLSDSNKIHYDMSIVKNVTDKSLVNGITVNKNTSNKKDSKASVKNKTSTPNSSKSKSTPKRNDSDSENEENTESITENNFINVLTDDDNTKLFLAGGVFAISIFAVITISYFTGKKHSSKKDDN